MAEGSKFVARGAAGYDRFMGQFSARLAPHLIGFAGLAAGERVIDVGCGTGNLAFALQATGLPGSIDAVDYDLGFVAVARERLPALASRIVQGDACALRYPDQTFDRAIAMLVLHFVGDPGRAALELRRILRPGGIAAACVWDAFAGLPRIRMFWDVIAAIEPAAAGRRDEQAFRQVSAPGDLVALFTTAGFTNVTATMLTIRMDFADFEDYWEPRMAMEGEFGAIAAASGRRSFSEPPEPRSSRNGFLDGSCPLMKM